MTAAFRVELDRLLEWECYEWCIAVSFGGGREGEEEGEQVHLQRQSWSKNKNDAAQSDPAPINVSHDTRVSNWGITLKT